MKNVIRLTFVAVVMLLAYSAKSQEFVTPSNVFSHQKDAFITLTDGTELVCKVDKIKRKKIYL